MKKISLVDGMYTMLLNEFEHSEYDLEVTLKEQLRDLEWRLYENKTYKGALLYLMRGSTCVTYDTEQGMLLGYYRPLDNPYYIFVITELDTAINRIVRRWYEEGGKHTYKK